MILLHNAQNLAFVCQRTGYLRKNNIFPTHYVMLSDNGKMLCSLFHAVAFLYFSMDACGTYSVQFSG